MKKKTFHDGGQTFVRITTTTRDALRAHCDRHGLKMGPFADAAIRKAITGPGMIEGYSLRQRPRPATRRASK